VLLMIVLGAFGVAPFANDGLVIVFVGAAVFEGDHMADVPIVGWAELPAADVALAVMVGKDLGTLLRRH
jgi:hypothetical protein